MFQLSVDMSLMRWLWPFRPSWMSVTLLVAQILMNQPLRLSKMRLINSICIGRFSKQLVFDPKASPFPVNTHSLTTAISSRSLVPPMAYALQLRSLTTLPQLKNHGGGQIAMKH